MKRSRLFLILLAVGGLLALGVGWLLTHLRASLGYSVMARYTQMPPDDKALEDWIKAQPMVVAPWAVHVDRKGDEVYVFFIRSEPIFPRSPFPKLAEECASLGYGPPADWEDVDR